MLKHVSENIYVKLLKELFVSLSEPTKRPTIRPRKYSQLQLKLTLSWDRYYLKTFHCLKSKFSSLSEQFNLL